MAKLRLDPTDEQTHPMAATRYSAAGEHHSTARIPLPQQTSPGLANDAHAAGSTSAPPSYRFGSVQHNSYPSFSDFSDSTTTLDDCSDTMTLDEPSDTDTLDGLPETTTLDDSSDTMTLDGFSDTDTVNHDHEETISQSSSPVHMFVASPPASPLGWVADQVRGRPLDSSIARNFEVASPSSDTSHVRSNSRSSTAYTPGPFSRGRRAATPGPSRSAISVASRATYRSRTPFRATRQLPSISHEDEEFLGAFLTEFLNTPEHLAVTSNVANVHGVSRVDIYYSLSRVARELTSSSDTVLQFGQQVQRGRAFAIHRDVCESPEPEAW